MPLSTWTKAPAERISLYEETCAKLLPKPSFPLPGHQFGTTAAAPGEVQFEDSLPLRSTSL